MKKLKGVEAADVVYDIVVVLTPATMDSLEDPIKKIRKAEGVSSTLTMLVAKP